jgi:hypothetical protein
MSTRATYQFITPSHTTTCYVHHDGYPEGAADYLRDAFTAEQFLRKNEHAELTGGHDAHGDTEYRYTIWHNLVNIEKRIYADNFDVAADTWKSIALCLTDGFISEYCK